MGNKHFGGHFPIMSSLSPISLSSIFGGMLATLLLALACADIRRMRLPDPLNILLAFTGLWHSLVLGLPTPADAGLGSLFGGGVFAFVGFAFHRLRGYEGLGLGDVKFASAAGFWVGWQGIPVMILAASICALAFAALHALSQPGFDRRTQLPFGPFLCIGTLLAWFLMISGQGR
jgi:leader peptidase (prepilin peptidase)/N-methyltransferase